MTSARAIVALLPLLAALHAPALRAEPPAMPAPTPTAETVWDGPGVTLLGAPSRDGRYLSYIEAGTGSLGLRTLATGASRILVPGAGKQFAYFSAIAPDSSQVAYAWFNAEGFYELRVVTVATGAVRTLFANEEAGFVQPCAWSPDGSRILTLLFRKDNISQIALIPATAGPPRVLRSLNWVYPKKMDFSPDGKYIVYDSFSDDKGPARTLFLLRTDGSSETRLLQSPGNHMFPVWTAAGIIYASGNHLMLLPMRDGQPAAAPSLWQPGLGRLVPLGVTAAGQYFYGLRSGAIDVEVVSLSQPQAPPRSVSLRFPGRNASPAWRPDGQAIAYLSRRGMENFGEAHQTVVIRTLSGGQERADGQEREVETGLAHLASLRWSPDGQRLLIAGTDGQGRAGLFDLPLTANATARLLIRDDQAGPNGLDGLWCTPQNVAYLAPDGLRLWRDGKSTLLREGKGFTALTASAVPGAEAATASLAWLAPDGIHLLSATGHRLLDAPAANLTELAHGDGFLLAGDGQRLWHVPIQGPPLAPKLLPIHAQRSHRLSLHPAHDRLAYSTGSTRSTIYRLAVPAPVPIARPGGAPR